MKWPTKIDLSWLKNCFIQVRGLISMAEYLLDSEGFPDCCKITFANFPNRHIEIGILFADNDLVCAHWSMVFRIFTK